MNDVAQTNMPSGIKRDGEPQCAARLTNPASPNPPMLGIGDFTLLDGFLNHDLPPNQWNDITNCFY